MDEVIALGDYLNDASMLELAGRSVATGNKLPEVKPLADLLRKRIREMALRLRLKRCCMELLME